MLTGEINMQNLLPTMNSSNLIAKFPSSRMKLTWKMQSLNFRLYGADKENSAKRNIQYIHFLHKPTQNSLYYPEWTFRTIRYCSDRLACQFSLCAWSELLCYFNELFRLVAGCIWAVTTSSMNNCYCLLKARCMEFMQIQSKGKICVCEGVLE